MSRKILIVDDEPGMRGLLSRVMEKVGHYAMAISGGEEAIHLIEGEEWHLVIADIDMPGMDGIELLKRIRSMDRVLPVIMITAYATVESAVEAMKLGAFDYITKPFQMDELKIVVAKVFEHERLVSERNMLLDEIHGRYDLKGIIGVSEKMREVMDLALSVAPSMASVLIEGESGTGKELVAMAIHRNSGRKDRPFVVVNCGALADGVLESELFGHERGAFSGAVATRKGRFELADGGTLFIDEIGELNPPAQVKLLRFLQSHEFERVGGARLLRSDARIVAATNRNLREMVTEGGFREDLFYRLNVVHIRVPALRERQEDVELLAEHFLGKYCSEMNKRLSGIAPEVIVALKAYDWKGNVRELENVMERAVVLCRGDAVTLRDLPEELRGGENIEGLPGGGRTLTQIVEAIERQILVRTLEKNGGSQTRTARELGIKRTTLRYKMAKYRMV
ncbi:MAG TPA: sigma-54-dependent Fis family transcriptional regulator [Proteobacteria bacterium]|nr:transcriptional regulatory protein ZraR [bacterium BMS3Abin14]HDL53660.1 sigma-54-dependent Fis family transcriptional regulator [Pseudomonadota bacterium]